MHCGERDQYQNVRHPDMRNIGASHFANQHFLAPDLKIYRKWGHMEPEQSPNMIRSYLGSARVHPILHRNKEGNLLKLSF